MNKHWNFPLVALKYDKIFMIMGNTTPQVGDRHCLLNSGRKQFGFFFYSGYLDLEAEHRMSAT